MPAKPLTPEQKADAKRLDEQFKAWQAKRKEQNLPSSQADAAVHLEMGQSALSQYLKGHIPLNAKALAKFCTLLGSKPAEISPAVAREMTEISQPLRLVALNKPEAEAEHFREQEESDRQIASIDEMGPQKHVASKRIPARPISTYDRLDELPPETTVLITHIDVALSAGDGRETWYIEELEPLPFQADYIRRLDAIPKNLVAVKVRGDSMETRLFNEDTVVVDRSDKRIPAGGGVFALVYAGEMLVKRLFALPGGAVDVVSDNPKYRSFSVTEDQLEHIDIIGRVKYRSGMGDF